MPPLGGVNRAVTAPLPAVHPPVTAPADGAGIAKRCQPAETEQTMASNTDTLPADTSVATREASRPPKSRRGALTWAAVLGAGIAVAALAVTTLRGNDAQDTPVTRFHPEADAIEHQAHLDGQAKTYGQGTPATTAPPVATSEP